ncbi:MAG: ParA family protein [Candidatus Thiodiazotropha sp. (ex Lucinoma aequizonata)]|nr:ParA family protein [Candidatus Thiodiazotropha sp. (ex Lucinoma aequizonata)]MCU7887682.1 ParA family protein [Candidatus Thiodiazotropha sp. (ex Lucinoma aequizonata)]MCU7897002.1 ParA family protein [Candidatus Thiodiazotropha sp. (ex Lucinoma aequizonata)]MCU7900176.1 ParA family protein [Candidatus Thiodiazotropha sp. (ex Lucinoma aequizonata)]MCU7901425.1 ParA family protein [Candidatus Thiodiazotropha sp. (ex Lucinoma aequizonata)]
MAITTIANRKGGVGKTTTALHVAYLCADTKRPVLYVDLDGQRNGTTNLVDKDTPEGGVSATLFSQKCPAPVPSTYKNIDVLAADNELDELSDVLMTEFSDLDNPGFTYTEYIDAYMAAFRNNLRRLSQDYAIVVVDTPPSYGIQLSAAMRSTDYVIAPLMPETYSIDGVHKLLDLIKRTQAEYNPDMEFLGFLLNNVDGRNVEHRRAVEEIRDGFSDLLFPGFIGHRTPIAKTAGTGLPAWANATAGNTKAVSRELKKVICHILKKAVTDHD